MLTGVGSADEVLARADAALYRAKAAGGDRVEVDLPDTTKNAGPADSGPGVPDEKAYSRVPRRE